MTDEVMQKMAERLRPPSFKEGFEKITVVRVKGSRSSAGAGDGSLTAEAETPVEDESRRQQNSWQV